MNKRIARRNALVCVIYSALGVASTGCALVGDLTGTSPASKYGQLQEGMTKAQAMAVMGKATSESFNGSQITTYTWKSSDGTRISASFRDDVLVGRSRGGYTRRLQDSRRLRRLIP